MIKAITFEIYQSKHDCTNDGISHRFNEGYLICEDGNNILDENNIPENTFIIEKRFLFGENHYSLKPYVSLTDGKWYMFGGNIGFTSDSRFGGNPLKIHDRNEG
jgi:hypothetical protein